MRYCLTGDSLVRLADGTTARIADLAPGAEPNSDTDVDLKVKDRSGQPVSASKVFHSGEHPTLRLRTREGYEVTGTHNHPVLTLRSVGGVPTLLWSLLEEMAPGDRVVLSRPQPYERGTATTYQLAEALLAGAWVSEGFFSSSRAGFNNVDAEFFAEVLRCVRPGRRRNAICEQPDHRLGLLLHELDVQNVSALRRSRLAELEGLRSADKRVPEFIWAVGAGGEGEVPAGALHRRRFRERLAALERPDLLLHPEPAARGRRPAALARVRGREQGRPARDRRVQGRHHEPP